MEDFDMNALDNVDFDAVESNVESKALSADASASEAIESMRDGASDCGDSCTI